MESSKKSVESPDLKTLTHGTFLTRIFPRGNSLERLGYSQKACSLLCARLPSPNFHLAEFFLRNPENSKAYKRSLGKVWDSHISWWALWHCVLESRFKLECPWCRNEGRWETIEHTAEACGSRSNAAHIDLRTQLCSGVSRARFPLRNSNHGICRNFKNLD